MRKVVLAVLAISIFCVTGVNAQFVGDEFFWETFREAAIRANSVKKANPVDPLDLTIQIATTKNRFANGKRVRKGESVVKEDENTISVTIGGDAILGITKYTSEGGAYEISIYYDGDILQRYDFSDVYRLYAVERIYYNYSGDDTIKESAENIVKKIQERLGWKDPLLPQTIEKALKKIQ